MSENKIPTAEESIKNYVRSSDGYSTNVVIDIEDAIEFAKEFAQLHVEAALKAAAKAENKYQNRNIFQHWSTETIILNAYPKTLIK